jgi:hypothetical protein
MNVQGVRAQLGALLACALMLTGCSTPSINPIYSESESEVVSDDRIVGIWAEEEDGQTKAKSRYEVLKRPTPESKWYPVRVTGGDAAKNGSYEVRLVQLGAHTYADFQPDKSERDRMGERLGLTALPVHVIYPVIIADDRITLRPLDGAKVRALVQETPKLSPHAIREDLIILTGDSRQVQEFFRKVVETEDLFAKRLELTRSEAAAESDGSVAVPDNTRSSRPGRTAPRRR